MTPRPRGGAPSTLKCPAPWRPGRCWWHRVDCRDRAAAARSRRWTASHRPRQGRCWPPTIVRRRSLPEPPTAQTRCEVLRRCANTCPREFEYPPSKSVVGGPGRTSHIVDAYQPGIDTNGPKTVRRHHAAAVNPPEAQLNAGRRTLCYLTGGEPFGDLDLHHHRRHGSTGTRQANATTPVPHTLYGRLATTAVGAA